MRLADYVSSSVRDLRRQAVRSSLTLVALILSSCLFVALVTLGLETRSAIVDQLGRDTAVNSVIVNSSKSLGGGVFSGNVQLANADGGKLDDSVASRLSELPGVESASPIVTVAQLRSFSVAGFDPEFVARVTAIDPDQSALFTLAAGRLLTADAARPEVVLGQGYAKALGLEERPDALVGQTVRFTTIDGYRGQGATIPAADATVEAQKTFSQTPSTLEATIVGVTTPDSNDNVLFVPLAWAHGLASGQSWSNGTVVTRDTIALNGYTSIVVAVGESADVRRVTASIDALGYGTSSKQAQIDQVNQLSIVMWIVLGSIAVISMISASLGIVNTMLMTVSEQRYAIGVWRVCGATQSLIVRLFLLQAAILGVLGGLVGTVLGRFISSYVNQKITHLLASQGLDGITIEPASTTALVGAVVVTTVLALLAGLYPALRAARHIYV